jgi:hypothetical protein
MMRNWAKTNEWTIRWENYGIFDGELQAGNKLGDVFR